MTSTLVAIDQPGGPAFVDRLLDVWNAGDAAFPVDQRLTEAAKASLCSAMRVGDRVEPGDALVLATSGSTGAPKGVILTHDAVAASAEATSHRIGVRSDDHWLACLPLCHAGGLSVVTRALHTGTELTVHSGFDAAAAVSSGATLVSLVTAALKQVEASAFRTIVLGGARPPDDLPAHVLTTYGLTETGSGVVYNGVPLRDVEIRLESTDGDGSGEILVRAPMLLRAYRDGRPCLDRDGWFRTGDLGSWAPDGRLIVSGRRGDLIVTGGENVWPDAVEAILAEHPAVADVMVRGIADATWGQIVEASVAVAPGYTVELAELREHVKANHPSYLAPKRLVVVDEIERTALGKLKRGQPPDPATPAPPSIT